MTITERVGDRQSKQKGAAPLPSATATGRTTVGNPSAHTGKAPQNPQTPANIYKWSRPLLTGSGSQTEFDVTPRKQTPEEFLTGARTHIRNSADRLFKARSDSGLVPHNTPSRELTPGVKTAKLNRQIHELTRDVTYRKQKAATCSNRQKHQNGRMRFWPHTHTVHLRRIRRGV